MLAKFRTQDNQDFNVREAVDNYLGKGVKHAAVTVPACFKEAQRPPIRAPTPSGSTAPG